MRQIRPAPIRPTMNDVARAAGVSLKTVSRVVNGEKSVRGRTAERVRVAVDRLGYRRNDIASSLRRNGTSASIGLIIEDLANPFYSQVARAVEEVATERGCLLIVGSSEESAGREHQLISTMLGRRVDGLIVVPAAADHSFLVQELKAGTPIVFLDRPPTGIEADSVLLDNVGGARTAVFHLLAHDHRRIALVGDIETIWTASERLRGYHEALVQAGIPADPALVRLNSHDISRAQAVTYDLLALPSPPTAIFAANNRNCVGVMRSLGSHRREVAVVGFDDFEFADMMGVSVVSYDPAELGRLAARRLFARIDGDGSPPRRLIIDVGLVERGSGEVPAR
jgi:LacI family transcriptional regulator